ncbi:MAG TPA: PilN domain-containing protein [Thermoanaerobaculia bacterium]|nr:PilN domain-containing protein [Thermoanaerobaculia bacterium]
MIKINLVREGRAVRGAGAAPAASIPGLGAAAGAPNLNNLVILGLVGLAILGSVAYWLINGRTLGNRQDVVQVRQAEAQKLEAIIAEVEAFQRRKDSLQNRIDLINQLKQNQKGPVRIMDRISQDLPDLVWLDKLTVAGGRVVINGRGLNPNAIANFVDNIKNDPYFEEPELGAVNEMTPVPLVYGFDMSFGFTYLPKTPGQPDGTAPGTTTAGAGAPAAGAAR